MAMAMLSLVLLIGGAVSAVWCGNVIIREIDKSEKTGGSQ